MTQRMHLPIVKTLETRKWAAQLPKQQHLGLKVWRKGVQSCVRWKGTEVNRVQKGIVWLSLVATEVLQGSNSRTTRIYAQKLQSGKIGHLPHGRPV